MQINRWWIHSASEATSTNFFLSRKLKLSCSTDKTQALKSGHLLPKFVTSKWGGAETWRTHLRLIPKHMLFPLYCVGLEANAKSANLQDFRPEISGPRSVISRPAAWNVTWKLVSSTDDQAVPHTTETETLGVGPAVCFNWPSWYFWCTPEVQESLPSVSLRLETLRMQIRGVLYNVGLFLLRVVLGINPFCD